MNKVIDIGVAIVDKVPCFICGQSTGNNFTAGKNLSQARLPIEGQLCPICFTRSKEPIMALVEVRNGEKGKHNPYRTGTIFWITKSSADKVGISDNQTMVYIQESDLRQLLGPQYSKASIPLSLPPDGLSKLDG